MVTPFSIAVRRNRSCKCGLCGGKIKTIIHVYNLGLINNHILNAMFGLRRIGNDVRQVIFAFGVIIGQVT